MKIAAELYCSVKYKGCGIRVEKEKGRQRGEKGHGSNRRQRHPFSLRRRESKGTDTL